MAVMAMAGPVLLRVLSVLAMRVVAQTAKVRAAHWTELPLVLASAERERNSLLQHWQLPTAAATTQTGTDTGHPLPLSEASGQIWRLWGVPTSHNHRASTLPTQLSRH